MLEALNLKISTIEKAITTLQKDITNLPDQKIFGQENIHNGIISSVESLSDLLTKNPGFHGKDLSFSRKGLIKLFEMVINKIVNNLKKNSQTKKSATNFQKNFNTAFEKLKKANELLTGLKTVREEIYKYYYHCFILIDRAGGGKTNLMCKMATKLAKIAPTILYFGKENFVIANLIQKTKKIVSDILNIDEKTAMEKLDQILEEKGNFLHIFIDGINECRNIEDMENNIFSFLEWSKEHRIKVTMTCRDIYWKFFDSDKWEQFTFKKKYNELYQFSKSETDNAIKLYLEHYKIKCTLKENAYESCKHPLLLRFFCEAYNDPNGQKLVLGTISNIRLIKLFDRYLIKKLDEIRKILRHSEPEKIKDFLLALTNHLFSSCSTFINSGDIQSITGIEDTVTSDSIYFRLRDEDIILEEEPGDIISEKKVVFVFEEFMEYLIATSFLKESQKQNFSNLNQIFQNITSRVNNWKNALGVIEYIILILLDSDDQVRVGFGFDFLTKLVRLGGIWLSAFWDIISKLPLKHINIKLFDLFYPAMSSITTQSEAKEIRNKIRNSITMLSKYNKKGAENFTFALLFSCLLPNVLNWETIEYLEFAPPERIKEISDELVKKFKNKAFQEDLKYIDYQELLKWLIPNFNQNLLRRRDSELGDYLEHYFKVIMGIIPKPPPIYQFYLINGIFHKDEEIARYCADRVRFINYNRDALCFFLKNLIKFEKREKVKNILSHSIEMIDQTLN